MLDCCKAAVAVRLRAARLRRDESACVLRDYGGTECWSGCYGELLVTGGGKKVEGLKAPEAHRRKQL